MIFFLVRHLQIYFSGRALYMKSKGHMNVIAEN